MQAFFEKHADVFPQSCKPFPGRVRGFVGRGMLSVPRSAALSQEGEWRFFRKVLLHFSSFPVITCRKSPVRAGIPGNLILRMSEESLLSAFSDLRQSLRRMTLCFLRNREDADDVVQEAFCRLWPRRGAIRDKEEASALTVTTVRNLCVDVLRERGKASFAPLEEEHDAQPERSPHDELELRERYAWVEQCIGERLTPAQRAVWKLRTEQELSTDEIADRLGMKPAAVRMSLSRARRLIRNLYKEWNDETR